MGRDRARESHRDDLAQGHLRRPHDADAGLLQEGGADPEEVVVREGEVLHVPATVAHQAEALEDTFVLGVFSPPRHGWLDSPDDESRG
jgi:uncharacterized protein YjlB